jgi:hypothetical protein
MDPVPRDCRRLGCLAVGRTAGGSQTTSITLRLSIFYLIFANPRVPKFQRFVVSESSSRFFPTFLTLRVAAEAHNFNGFSNWYSHCFGDDIADQKREGTDDSNQTARFYTAKMSRMPL